MYRVALTDTLDEDVALALWSGAGNASVFNHPGWWRSAIEAFGRRRRLIVASVTDDGGATTAIWPFWVKTLGVREMVARIIEPVGARVTDYVSPIVVRGHDPAKVVEAVRQRLAGELDLRTILFIPKLPVELDQPTFGFGTFHLDHRRVRTCLSMDLPASVATLERQWSKRLRGDVRRQTKRLEAFGPLTLWVAGSRDEIIDRLPVLCQIHARTWGERTGVSELAPGSAMVTFIEGLARHLPVDLLHVSELRIGDQPVSVHFGFQSGGALLWYKPAYDIAWQSYSPGKLHIAFGARAAISQELRELDFLQGDEPYKRDWATRERQTVSRAIASPSGYAVWAWNTRIRRMAAEYRY